MNRTQATALARYISRCVEIVPTTVTEWEAMRSLLPTIEAVANGHIELVTKEQPTEKPKEATT